MRAGTTTFTAELGCGVIVVTKIAALVCAQCGADWIVDEVAIPIEELVGDSRKRCFQSVHQIWHTFFHRFRRLEAYNATRARSTAMNSMTSSYAFVMLILRLPPTPSYAWVTSMAVRPLPDLHQPIAPVTFTMTTSSSDLKPASSPLRSFVKNCRSLLASAVELILRRQTFLLQPFVEPLEMGDSELVLFHIFR